MITSAQRGTSNNSCVRPPSSVMSSNFKYNLSKTLKKYSKLIPQLTKPVLRVLIQVSVHYIESRQCQPEALDVALAKLSHSAAGGEAPAVLDHFHELFAAVLQTMQLFLRAPRGSVRDAELRDALRHVRFADECVDDLSRVLHNHRDQLAANYAEVRSLRTAPRRVQWCVNLSLVESGITKVAQPSIVLHLQLRNGQYVTFEVPLAMFHRLRYAVASLLVEFQALESRGGGVMVRK